MKYSYIFAFVLILLAMCLSQAKPINEDIITSTKDITGEPVRQKRYSNANDYFICYPSSVVYGYQNSLNALQSHRRSSESERQFVPFDSFEARKDRADRERAAYTDSFGK